MLFKKKHLETGLYNNTLTSAEVVVVVEVVQLS